MINETLVKINNQIEANIDKYEFINKENIKVYVKDKKFYFQVGDIIHIETEKELKTSYDNNEKINSDEVLARNIHIILSNMDDIAETEHL